ncbi:hypothetical protein U1Q18_032778 [Sarracenia purpurea var. burkii]
MTSIKVRYFLLNSQALGKQRFEERIADVLGAWSLCRPQQGHILEVAIEAATSAVIDLRDSLNELDGKVGDGGYGSTMFRGATAILEDMKKQ